MSSTMTSCVEEGGLVERDAESGESEWQGLLSGASAGPRATNSEQYVPGQGQHSSARETEIEAAVDSRSYASGSSEPNGSLSALLDSIGMTPLQWQCIFILGLAIASDAVEVLSIGFIVTVFKDPVSGKPVDELAFWSGFLTASVFVGMMAGGLLSGSRGDKQGRKPMLTLSLGTSASAALLSATTPLFPAPVQLTWLVLTRILGGIGVGGSVPSAFALAAELGPRQQRGFAINIVAVFWSVGVLYTSLCAWILLSGDSERGNHNWPWFAAVVSLPAALATSLCATRLEESPRLLSSSGRSEELSETLLHFLDSARPGTISNAAELRAEILEMKVVEGCAGHGSRLQAGGPALGLVGSVKALMRHEGRTTILISGVFFFLSFSHYGISTWISDLFKKVHFENPYLTSVFYTVASVPGLLLAIVLVDRIGRRKLTVWSMAGACLGAGMFAFWSDANQGAVLLCAALFNAAATSAWNAVDIFSAELFPSQYRGMGLGVAAAMGRVGSIAANFVNARVLAGGSDTSGVAIVLTLAGFAMVGGASCAVLLPETMIARH